MMKDRCATIEKNLQYALECWRNAKDRDEHCDIAGNIEHLKKAVIAFKGLAEQIETHVKQLELDLLYAPDSDEPWYQK